MDQKLDFSQNLTLFDKLCSKSETNINLNVDKDNKSVFDSFKNENNNLFFRKKEDKKEENLMLNKKRPCEISKDSKPKLINNNESNKSVINERLLKLKKKKEEIIDTTISGDSMVITQDMIDLMKKFIKNYEENKENEEKYILKENENRDLKNKIEILQNELNEKNKITENVKKYEKLLEISYEKFVKVELLLEKEKEITKNLNQKNSEQIFEILNLKLEIEKSNEIKFDTQSQILKLKKELDSSLKHNTIIEDLTYRLQNTINTIQIEFKEKYTLLISEKLKAEDTLDHFRKEFLNLTQNKR